MVHELGWRTAQNFEDYLVKDLVDDVESRFRVIRSRYGRAIAGLSMGATAR